MNEIDSIEENKKIKAKKPNIFRRFRGWCSRIWKSLHPSPRVRRGAAAGIVLLVAVIAIVMGIFIRPGFKGIYDSVSGSLFFLIMAGLMGLLIGLVLKILSILSRFLTWVGLIMLVIFILFIMEFKFPFPVALLIGFVVGLAQAFLVGALVTMFSKKFKNFSVVKKVFVILAILVPLALNIYIVTWLADRGSDTHLAEKKAESLRVEPLDAPDPSLTGPYGIITVTYGSGTDKRRPEFGKDADLKTESVDATPFVKNNKGWRMKVRKWYWGFDFKKFPVNGRVWYPSGDGPFPLVLIVHGNHKMEEYSDPGYEYLGKLLASRGFIFVSVDENFFNGSFLSGLRRENDGRGWMLLQHLKVWRKWNKTEGNPFFGKVAMDNIGLIGHSRGGEAAAIAGFFNRLSRYPDDATIEFDFDFNIKAIVSISPSDGQYKPAGRPTPLENVNYLVFQGAHDADVSSFAGMRQYNRVKFTDGQYWFKASLYSYCSNHGQFNTVWGDSDWGKPTGILLNRKPLLDGEEQRQISKIYITAFLETTLHNKAAYIPLFRDFRLATGWLPDDIYINRFEDSTFRVVSNFDEDVDVTTATLDGTKIQTNNLAVWREADLGFRRSGTKQNNVVYVGWREPESEEQEKDISFYAIGLPDDIEDGLNLTTESFLVFSLADADEKPPEPEEEGEEKEEEDESQKDEEKEDKEPIDLSVELVTSDGQTAKLPLSCFMAVPPVLKSRFTKLKKENNWYGKAYEPTLQIYELPLAIFVDEFPDFNLDLLKEIRFVFDRSPEGVVIIDSIGFAMPYGQKAEGSRQKAEGSRQKET